MVLLEVFACSNRIADVCRARRNAAGHATLFRSHVEVPAGTTGLRDAAEGLPDMLVGTGGGDVAPGAGVYKPAGTRGGAAVAATIASVLSHVLNEKRFRLAHWGIGAYASDGGQYGSLPNKKPPKFFC